MIIKDVLMKRFLCWLCVLLTPIKIKKLEKQLKTIKHHSYDYRAKNLRHMEEWTVVHDSTDDTFKIILNGFEFDLVDETVRKKKFSPFIKRITKIVGKENIQSIEDYYMTGTIIVTTKYNSNVFYRLIIYLL
jgi:predicted ATPase